MTLRLGTTGKFFFLFFVVASSSNVAAHTSLEFYVFRLVHCLIVGIDRLVFLVKVIVAASCAAGTKIFFTFHRVVAVTTFDVFVGAVVEDNRF